MGRESGSRQKIIGNRDAAKVQFQQYMRQQEWAAAASPNHIAQAIQDEKHKPTLKRQVSLTRREGSNRATHCSISSWPTS